MLTVYLTDVAHCKFNDVWFEKYLDKINFNNETIQRIIKQIDEVQYLGNKSIKSKFDSNVAVSVRELSTGCKTAINIFSFPDQTFSIAECGSNAINTILKFKSGKIYIPFWILVSTFKNDIIIDVKGNRQIIHNNKQLEIILDKRFRMN